MPSSKSTGIEVNYMKRYLSIFMLLARSVFCKLLAVLAGTAALHGAVFFLLREQRNIEAVYDHWSMRCAFGAGLVLTVLLLISTLSQFGSKLDYTLRRLRVSRYGLFFCQSVFDVACLLLFWAVEIFVALALCILWMNNHEVSSHQAVYLSFYRSDLLHSLLPLDDVTRWIRNLAAFAALGVCCAAAPILQRRGEQHLGVLVLPVVFAFAFPGGIAEVGNDVLMGVMAVICAFALTVAALGEEFQRED